jgi:hypothetical protein
VFSDNPTYKAYDYAMLMKKHHNRDTVNSIIADKLLAIRSEKKSHLSQLAKLNDRFNPQIALDFSAEYLKYCKSKIDTKVMVSEPLKSYAAKYKDFDFSWLLALNGYNK